MNMPRLLSDNDVVIKLARMDASVDGFAAIGVHTEEVASLAVMLRYMGKASEERRLRLTSNRAESDRLMAVLQALMEIEPSKDESVLAATLMREVLSAGLDMQEGEIGLLAVAITRGGMDVATGDKRALCCLPKLQERATQLAIQRRRMICFEQIFLRLAQQHGMGRLKAAIASAPDADTTITTAVQYFESHGGAGSFVRGMQKVIGERIDQFAPGWLKLF